MPDKMFFLIKIRGDECPKSNINPASWKSQKFQLMEYFKNLNSIDVTVKPIALIWINESSRKITNSQNPNGNGLTAIANISNANSETGEFKLSNVRSFTKHLNLNNFLSKQKDNTFEATYKSQRTRVRELDNNDLAQVMLGLSRL